MTIQSIKPEDFTILLVDDDIYISEMINLYLKNKGFHLHSAFTGMEALEKLQESPIDLVILDVMLPEMDGWEVCRQIRKTSDLPILMLTAKGESEEKVMGFSLGADDYLVKPFDPNELVARVISLLRRAFKTEKIKKSPSIIQFGQIKLDTKGCTVTNGEYPIDLTPREYQLLFVFANHPNQVFQRQQLLDLVWGEDFFGEERVVDVFVTRLRQKLVHDDATWKIDTVRGIGYKFTVEDDHEI